MILDCLESVSRRDKLNRLYIKYCYKDYNHKDDHEFIYPGNRVVRSFSRYELKARSMAKGIEKHVPQI